MARSLADGATVGTASVHNPVLDDHSRAAYAKTHDKAAADTVIGKAVSSTGAASGQRRLVRLRPQLPTLISQF